MLLRAFEIGLDSQSTANCSTLQAVECLGETFRAMRPPLLQPPLHQRNLCSNQIIGQHIKRNRAVRFYKNSAQIRFDLPCTSVTDLSQDELTIFTLKDGVQQRPSFFKMSV